MPRTGDDGQPLRRRSTLPGAPSHPQTSRSPLFLAEGLTPTPTKPDDGGGEVEDIAVCWFSLAEATRMALDGRIGEDVSALQILRLADREQTA